MGYIQGGVVVREAEQRQSFQNFQPALAPPAEPATTFLGEATLIAPAPAVYVQAPHPSIQAPAQQPTSSTPSQQPVQYVSPAPAVVSAAPAPFTERVASYTPVAPAVEYAAAPVVMENVGSYQPAVEYVVPQQVTSYAPAAAQPAFEHVAASPALQPAAEYLTAAPSQFASQESAPVGTYQAAPQGQPFMALTTSINMPPG